MGEGAGGASGAAGQGGALPCLLRRRRKGRRHGPGRQAAIRRRVRGAVPGEEPACGSTAVSPGGVKGIDFERFRFRLWMGYSERARKQPLKWYEHRKVRGFARLSVSAARANKQATLLLEHREAGERRKCWH